MDLIRLLAMEAKKKLIDGTFRINRDANMRPNYRINEIINVWDHSYTGSLNVLIRLSIARLLSSSLPEFLKIDDIAITGTLKEKISNYDRTFEDCLYLLSYHPEGSSEIALQKFKDIDYPIRAVAIIDLIIEKGMDFYK